MSSSLLAAALAAAGLLTLTAPALAADDHVPGEVVVRFADDRQAGTVARALDAVDATGSTSLAPLPGTRVVALDGTVPVADAVVALERRPDVLWAEPNYVRELQAAPNDPAFSGDLLWGLRNLGQADAGGQSGLAGVDLGAAGAWDVTTGSPDVLVGVLDSGIADHPDLDANVRDDLSRDFRNPFDADGDPRLDPDGHGTHVAGTIAAVGDNGVGTVGVSWRAGLVSLRALHGRSGTSANIARAYAYAGQRGLPIVNASIGGSVPSMAEREAIALADRTLFVVAAGNETSDVDAEPAYPCSYPAPNVVCVASIDNLGDLSWFSNWGATTVDLAAPGSAIHSTVPTFSTAWTTDLSAFPAGWATYGVGDGWAYDAGELVSNFDEPYGPNLDMYAQLPPVNVAGREACSLELRAAIDADGTPESARSALVAEQLGADGVTWQRIGTLLGPTAPQDLRWALYVEGGVTQVRLRYLTVSMATPGPYDGATVSSLRVACGAAPGYGVKNGTSMASPHVAGVAALLLARRPGLTTAQLRDALLSTTRPLAGLAGRTVTGGLVDAPAALAAVAPPTPRPAPPSPGGGGGSPAPAEPAPTVPAPSPPAPAVPAAPQDVQGPPAAQPAPRVGLAGTAAARRVARTGDIVVRLRSAVATTARVTGTLRWRGGSARLRPVRRTLAAGTAVRVRVAVAGADDRHAVRSAQRQGRALRVVLRVRAGSSAVRETVRLR